MRSVAKLPSRYRIGRRLGRGGFGEVFEVYDSHSKQTLALKILSDTTENTQETLTREFEVLSRLQHPNLVRVFDYGTIPFHRPYFTMELVKGLNLRDFLGEPGNTSNLPLIIKQTLAALIYLNKNRILHGDIKPENIIIALDEQSGPTTKLLDFGLSSTLGDGRRLVSGTLRYLAPEILFDGGMKSPATDLYALGASLIESILSEKIPRADEIDPEFLRAAHAKLNNAFANSSIKNPSALSSFILDLLRPDLSDRMRNAEEANRSLELIIADRPPRPGLRLGTTFIGRKRELDTIEHSLNDPDSGIQVVTLEGPPGIGKKSILHRFVRSFQLKGVLPIDLTPSGSFFSLEQFIGTLGSHMNAIDRRRLISSLPSWTRLRRRRPISDLDPDRATVLFARVINFLIETSTSQKVLIMALDVERSSRDLLSFLVQLVKQMELTKPQITVALTSNTEYSGHDAKLEELSRIARSPLTLTMEVPAFDEELLKKYLGTCFGRTLFPAKERHDILSKTEGLPILIEVYLNSLVAANAIQYVDGHWILDRKLYQRVRIPLDLDDSFSYSLHRPSKDELILLRILALCGTVPRSELPRIASTILEDPERILADLLEKRILILRDRIHLSFAHPLYAQYIVEDIPYHLRRDYSSQIASVLIEARSEDSLQIAWLCIWARWLDRAMEYGFAAVDKMYSSYLLYDCLKLLLDLRSLAAEIGSKAKVLAVLERLAPVERATGLPKQAVKDYAVLASSSREEPERAQYYMRIAQIHYDQLGNLRQAETALRRALHFAKKSQEPTLLAAVYYGLGGLNLDNSVQFLERAVKLSSRTDINLYLTSLAILAYKYQLAGMIEKASAVQSEIMTRIDEADLSAKKQILFHLQSISFYKADYKAAKVFITRKIRLDRRTEDSSALALSMSSLAGCYYTEGSFHKMIDTLREAYNAGMKYDNYLIAITILANLSLGYRSIADYGQSEHMLSRAREIISREVVQELNASYWNKPTMLNMILGKAREPEFEASAHRLLERARSTDNRIGLGHHSMAFALYHLNRLEPDKALVHAKKALSYFRKAADRDDVVHALISIAIIQMSLAKPRLAATSLREAEELYEVIHCEYLKPQLLLAKGMLARLQDPDDAGKVLADAQRTSKKMGTREITWQVQRELALYHRDRGEPHKALAFYRDAVETIKQITETLDEEDLRMSYLEVPFRRRVFDEIKSLRRESDES